MFFRNKSFHSTLYNSNFGQRHPYQFLYYRNFIILGPLVYIDPNTDVRTATLIGIVSWSGACGYPEYPDVYGRVTKIVEWITKETGKLIHFHITYSFKVILKMECAD